MSVHQKANSYISTWIVAVLCSTFANAQSWQGHDEMSPQGLHSATLTVQKHEFALSISCNETAAETSILNLMFFGPSLPRLYGTDGQEETLLISFNRPNDTSLIRKWEVYYYDGGLGDQAWMGKLEADNQMLDAFSGAQDISLLNTDRELIYEFPAKGTSAGTALLRQTCGVAQTW